MLDETKRVLSGIYTLVVNTLSIGNTYTTGLIEKGALI